MVPSQQEYIKAVECLTAAWITGQSQMDTAAVLYEYARLALAGKNYKVATDLTKQAYKIDPDQIIYIYYQGVIVLMENGNLTGLKKAEYFLMSAIKNDPDQRFGHAYTQGCY